jgi:hypothetical protein
MVLQSFFQDADLTPKRHPEFQHNAVNLSPLFSASLYGARRFDLSAARSESSDHHRSLKSFVYALVPAVRRGFLIRDGLLLQRGRHSCIDGDDAGHGR